VSEFNATAGSGLDPVFGRGRGAYDRYRGDPRITPNPNVRPLDDGPYYGLELFLGTLGTKGGPRTDAAGRVLGLDEAPIEGLFAVGNVAANVFGPGYPGAGSTLGSGMTFARLAGLASVGAPDLAARA
jgi:3-oxosteroid 1-dehydrogenase